MGLMVRDAPHSASKMRVNVLVALLILRSRLWVA